MFSEGTSTNQRGAKLCTTVLTVVYVILFPVFLWMALFWSAASDPSSVGDFVTIFTWFLTPLAIPFSIYSMKSKYRAGEYSSRSFYIYCALPLLAFCVFVLINAIVRA